MAKFITVFCVLLVAYGAQCTTVSELTSVVTNYIEEAADSVDAASQSLTDAFDDAVSYGNELLTEFASNVDAAVAEADEYIANATDAAAECATAYSSAVQSAAEIVTNSSAVCVADVIADLQSYTDQGQAIVANYSYQAANLSTELTSCITAYTSASFLDVTAWATMMACVAKVQLEATVTLVASAATTISNLGTLASEIGSAQAELAECAAETTFTALQESITAAKSTYDACVAELDTSQS